MVGLGLIRIGFSATLIGVPFFQFLYFGMYYNLKTVIHYENKVKRDLIAAMLSGSICQILTNPIWVIRVRMQSAVMHQFTEEEAAQYRTVAKSFSTIYKKEGWMGLYKGTIISQIGTLD